jgi:hypothetical protein
VRIALLFIQTNPLAREGPAALPQGRLKYAPVRLGLLLSVISGCATPLAALKNRAELQTPVGQFVVEFADADRGGELTIQEAVKAAGPSLTRWGTLKEPVVIRVMPSHELLEQATDREGYGWLKAWARYDEVYVQSPRTWGLFGGNRAEVDELLLHELTHCLMYQLAANRQSWRRKEIPLWFREGMASFTAQQAYRWPTLDQLAKFYDGHPELDPVAQPEALYKGQSPIVYSAAHHSFTFLVQRYGLETVRAMLQTLQSGESFPQSFEQAVGLPAARFVRDFRRYVTWRGYRPAPRIAIPPPASAR